MKAHGNVDIIEYGAEGQNVKALDSCKSVKHDDLTFICVIRNENFSNSLKCDM